MRAIIAALDRAGIVVPTHVDVAIGTRPFEDVFDAIAGGSREESRRARGYADADDTNALEPRHVLPAGEIIDAEPVGPRDLA